LSWPWTGEMATRLAHGHGDQPRLFVRHRRRSLRRELLLPLRPVIRLKRIYNF
jgi:hypothetical protein